MTIIYLVRHGESQANVERVFSNGRVDLPLTARGLRQAEQVAAWLEGRGLAHVFTSPLLRARQTAAVIGRRLGLDVSVLADLDEIRVGDLDGQRGPESWAIHDRVLARWRAGDRSAAFPGGETFGQACDRFAGALRTIAQRYPHHAVAAVTHGAIQGTVLPRLCPDLGEHIAGGTVSWSLRNGAITCLEVSPQGFTCRVWGHTSHISAED
jgi:broad specificity phosphatase PhoE